MKLVFPLDRQALIRKRYLTLIQNYNPRYKIKKTPIYQPLIDFLNQNRTSGYSFKLIKMLHVTGQKMLGYPSNSKQRNLQRNLFASGGLYLALDINHSDLAIRQHFGDFTSGFSHQFGVALSIMSMSEVFQIPWGNLTPIPVQGKRVLDFTAKIPNSNNWLQIEAKGVTSKNSRNSARSDIAKKKRVQRSQQNNQTRSVAIVGVIVQAAKGGPQGNMSQAFVYPNTSQGLIEVIDPEPDHLPDTFNEHNQKAGLYWHYAGAALFAGLSRIADEFIRRANLLITGQQILPSLTKFPVNENSILKIAGHRIIGIQWRPGDSTDPSEDIWFYQGLDVNVIHYILTKDSFPETRPYSSDENLLDNEDYAESLLPDGSYFGIGTKAREGLLIVDQRETDIWNLRF